MDGIKKLIAGLSVAQRISIVAVAVLLGVGIFTFSRSRYEGDFRPLYSSMSLEDASTVVQKLKETGVEYRLTDNGSTVLVPSGKLAESRLNLAAAGLPKTGRIGFELFDKTNFGATEFVEHINYKRALEGELERSVMSMAEVEQARVHLSLPKESVFLDQQQPAKASVMVKLRPGASLAAQNVMAVAHLVASAVEGLSPEAVAILDMDGHLLSRPRRTQTGEEAMSSEALEFRQQIEHSLVQKISATLEPLLGTDGFRAGVSVDCDMTSSDQQEETLDPSRSVMLSSQRTEDGGQLTASAGVPGTASNLPTPPSRQASAGGLSRRTENITYQTSRTVRRTRIPQGIVRRMSLAVLVGQSLRWEGAGASRHRVPVPPSADTMKTIKDLVAGVTGFSTERGDQLIVETLPFESIFNSDQGDPATSGKPISQDPPWLQFFNKNRTLVVLAAVGALVLIGVMGFLMKSMSRKKRRAAIDIEAPASLPASTELPPDLIGEPTHAAARIAAAYEEQPREEDLLKQVAGMVQGGAAPAAAVVRMWLRETAGERS
ncbi:MAG: flagellar M-ring protein FliF [Acidobacteria bacterium]|nr:flagellar M-ring protein FliF [Acidobacteriota bacterium]